MPAPKQVRPGQYEVDLTPLEGNTLDGDMRHQVRVTVTFYATPTGPGTTAGSIIIRAWLKHGALQKGEEMGLHMIEKHKRRRAEQIRRKIARIHRSMN